MYLDFKNLSSDDLILLKKIAYETQDDFNKLNGDMIKANNYSNQILFSNICSRNIYECSLYKLCVELIFIDKKIEYNDELKVFKNISPEIIQLLIDKHPKIKFKSARRNFSISSYLNRIKDLFRILRYSFYCMLTSSNKRKNEIIFKNKIITLIDIFLLKNSLKESRVIDRYYTGMLDFVDKSDKSKIFYLISFACNFNLREIKKLCKKSKTNLILKQDFLDISDYFNWIFKMIIFKFSKDKFFFRGFDLTKVVNHLNWLYKYNFTQYDACLNYSLIKNFKSNGLKIKLLIDWNENQVTDKSLLKGMNDFYQNSMTKSYQGYAICRKYNFHLLPTKYEINLGLSAKKIFTIGDIFKEEINKNCEHLKFDIAPAFRFKTFEKPQNIKSKRIYLLLPININESIELVMNTYKAFSNYSEFNFVVRLHPTLSLNKFKSRLKNNVIDFFEFSHESFDNIIRDAAIFLGNSTSALIEAALSGVPVIIIPNKNWVTQNPFPDICNKRLFKKCNTFKELPKIVIEMFEISKYKLKEDELKSIKEKYLMKVDKKNTYEFLDII